MKPVLIVRGLIACVVAALLLIVASSGVFLMRTGRWTAYWQEQMVSPDQVAPDGGFAFRTNSGRDDLSSDVWPSPAMMFENGVRLSLANSPHAEIRNIGNGRYSFWHDEVYFSSSDDTDPRTNGRRYTLSYPPISRVLARVMYLGTGAVAAFAALLTALSVSAGLLGAAPVVIWRAIRDRGALPLSAISIGGLVAIGVLRASPLLAPIVSVLWIPVLGVNLMAAWVIRLRYGARVPVTILAAFLVGLSLSFYFLTARAPHRSQGCHTADPYPVWDLFCTAPDSSSYYFGYSPGSTRQPLYPWFITALTSGTGFDPASYLTRIEPGGLHTDPADPLFRVVRWQEFLMLASAVIACAFLMRLLGSPLPAVAFLALYDQQFLSAVELNIVLTEPLVMALMFLFTAMFAAFFTSTQPIVLLLAALFAGLAYLARQASVYSVLMLGVMMLAGLTENWRRWSVWSAAALAVFVALCGIPDLMAYASTGSIARQQESLQYQYRIAHAMQFATLADVALMPDDESREWLSEVVPKRDHEHRLVEEQYGEDEYNKMIYYINANLYSVATPEGGYHGAQKSPAFFMKVATPILENHLVDNARFSFRFWQYGLTKPGIVRLDVFDFSPWLTYFGLWMLVLVLRDAKAVAAAAMILSHWAAVAITCLAAVPIPRMIGASEFLVVLAAVILFWDACERVAADGWWGAIESRFRAAAH